MQVHRDVLRYRSDPLCACAALPDAVAASFVPLIDATLPQLAGRGEQAIRAHGELVVTFGLLLGEEGEQLAAEEGEDAEAERTLLQAVRRTLKALPQMDAPLRLELLRMLAGIVGRPAERAVARDACWREALAALCELATAEQEQSPGSPRALPSPRASTVVPRAALTAFEAANMATPRRETAREALAAREAQAFPFSREAHGALRPGSPSTRAAARTPNLAAPLLLDAAKKALLEWASVAEGAPPPPHGAMRAAQLLSMLRMLCALRVPSTSVDAASRLLLRRNASEAPVDPRDGQRGHLVRLAPALVACIGRGGGKGAPDVELQAALRDALSLVVDELGGLE